MCVYVCIVPKSFVGNITQRPELVKGSFEYILAQPDPARSPIVCFVLDISSAAVSNGSLTLIASTLQQVLVPGSGATVSRVAFVTYDSRSIHFWDISATQKRPRMLVVTAAIDGDICIPGLLSTDVAQCSPSLSFFLTHLNDFAEHANPHSSQSQSLPPLEHAICAATQLIKAHKVGGRVVAFSSAAPTASREADVPLAPLSTAYRTLGKACARDGVGVDLFLFAPASQLARRHQDVATLGEVARVTGGQLYRYDSINNGFGWAFSADLRRNLSRTWGCSATLQVRASKGVFSAEYLGNFIPVGTGKGRCASFATIDADKAIGVVFSHGSGTLSGHVMFQAALLYTSAPNGALCLRVHTVAVPSTAAIPAVFRSCDCDAMVGLTARLAVDAMRWSGKPPAQAGKDVVATTVEAFAAYRAACTRMPAAGQLVLPDSLSLLPLYISCLLKSPLLAPAGAVSADMRSVAMATTGANTLPSTLTSLYPRAYFLDSILPPSSPQQQQQKLSMTSSVTSNDDVSNDVSGNKNAYLYVFPRAVRLNLDAYLPDGVYLLDSGGPTVLIFVGESPDPDVAEHLFGTRDVAAIPAHTLTEAFSERLQQWTVDAAAAATAAGPGELAARFPMLALVQELARVRGHSCFGFRVVRDVDVRSDLTLMSQVYAEDSMKSCLSYSEFLCQLHDKIIQKLSHT